jgi:hypothetical protein
MAEGQRFVSRTLKRDESGGQRGVDECAGREAQRAKELSKT